MSLFVLNSSVPVSASESIRQQVKNIFSNKKKVQRNDLNKIKINELKNKVNLININELTPLEAINILNKLIDNIKEI